MIKKKYNDLKNQCLELKKIKKDIKNKKEILLLRKIDNILSKIIFFYIVKDNKKDEDNDEVITIASCLNIFIPAFLLIFFFNKYYIFALSTWYFLLLCKFSLFIFDIDRFEDKKAKKELESKKLDFEKLKILKTDPAIINSVFFDLDDDYVIKHSSEVIDLIKNVENTNINYFFKYRIKNNLTKLYENGEITFEEFVLYIKKYLASFDRLDNNLISDIHKYINTEKKNIKEKNEILNFDINNTLKNEKSKTTVF